MIIARIYRKPIQIGNSTGFTIDYETAKKLISDKLYCITISEGDNSEKDPSPHQD